MLYSCTDMATVGVKGLKAVSLIECLLSRCSPFIDQTLSVGLGKLPATERGTHLPRPLAAITDPGHPDIGDDRRLDGATGFRPISHLSQTDAPDVKAVTSNAIMFVCGLRTTRYQQGAQRTTQALQRSNSTTQSNRWNDLFAFQLIEACIPFPRPLFSVCVSYL